MTAASPLARRRWYLAGSALCALVLLSSVSSAVNQLAHEETMVVDEMAAGAVDTVEIGTPAGDVVVVGTETDTITITTHVANGLRPTTVTQQIDDRRLVLDGSCPLLLSSWCRVDYRIEVPRSMAVESRSRRGRIEIVGIDGAVSAATDDGAVEVRDLGGDSVVTSRNGTVTGTDMRAASVEASSVNGAVLLSFRSPPANVDARSRNGTVTVELAEGLETYAVDIATRSGDVTSAVRTDPNSNRAIAVHSDHGDVTLRYRTG